MQKGHSKYSNLNKMKRQRNIQQVKKHDKNPSNQTKEEEIRNLSEKEFIIMKVKMVQNLERKMELQIDRLETRIKEMQEMFNKDLEEMTESQSIMNNAITEIKSTLEGTDSRITEAEERISVVENRVVELNEAERKEGGKRIKRNEDNLRNLWDNFKCPNIQVIGVPMKKAKSKHM